jgi:hypothetical protein
MAFIRSFARICPPESESKPTILNYLCQSIFPDTHVNQTFPGNLTFAEQLYVGMTNRLNFDDAVKAYNFKFHPRETTVFKTRFDTLSSNNKAFRIATSTSISVADCEDFSYIKPGWALLFPLKMSLIAHPQLARNYFGFLPFGSEVIAWFNFVMADQKFSRNYQVGTQPTLADHVLLQDYSKTLAIHHGMTTVAVNHYMYMEGKKLLAGIPTDVLESVT